MSIGKGEVISKDLPRVKFGATRVGKPRLNDTSLISQLQELGALQHHLEEIGVVPILDDGLVGGNCSLKSQTGVFVSPSGKEPLMELQGRDFVEIENFDRTGWSLLGQGSESTSCWSRLPNVVVHGHALADGEGLDAAKRSGFPISDRETLFSTPDDLVELENLFEHHPYPANQCFIRRGHGFLVLADSVKDASDFISKKLEPLL
eukprot:jgi/Picre1/36024/NNA_003481.t1